ncbi:M20 aminoacylase family protein [Aquicoccus porphyridii]|uniref:Amidohydrolase n=2 Tax=Aquicoccus porphyridii TaxID=1852029 RepID=A0A5A9Z588_9RHOB|nr:M20 aminoacylase family protein [Aquicoccus porphyridii]KAA0912350.1 amidohydrolase [Aquicoccus porphyridii]RAI54158.1 amidohydrolase [Rhodobacteraceae bacterium AsT-22]
MPIMPQISDLHAEMTEWRRDFHAHPELNYQEQRTSDLVAERLERWGIEVHRGLGGTGVVGVLRQGNGPGAIGLRADMDALPMQELSDVPHRSTHDGVMHACGHDGHTTMLLGAARYLAETRNFSGTVVFIFQPAEEKGSGAKRMISEGLFARFPCDTIWALHNAPTLPKGRAAVRPGPVMAAVDGMKIVITGKGTHGARPHAGNDPISVGVQLHTAFQHVVTKNIDPIDTALVNVTQFHSGTAVNVVPPTAELHATIRTFREEVRQTIRRRIHEICAGMEAVYGVKIALEYRMGCAPTVNTAAEAASADRVLASILGEEAIIRNNPPTAGGEDFADMLAVLPGAYIHVGSGEGSDDPGLHHPSYDFNDDILPIGASYFAALVEDQLRQDN